MKPITKLLVFLLLFLSVFSAQAALPIQDSSGQPLPSLAPMLKKVNPAVVNIATYSTERETTPLLNDPFFRFFFNVPDQPHPHSNQTPKKQQQSAGSGVILNAKDGTVITNYHVIKGADEVHVSLVDGRSYKAKIVGFDKDLDIAVLKIKADNLTAIKLADSAKLQVGDFVVAIGNPFALGQTVTTGIVSALGRTGLGIEGYENFIQTDASINPGNSGGALVNLHGELEGINTAIIAPSGGNVGIGFAIPINMVDASVNQILKYGKVSRGQIGVSIQNITPELRSAFNLKNGQRGVLVAGVEDGSPAKAAGLKTGDVITAINGEPTDSTGQLRSQIGMKAIGDKLELSIIREGKALDKEVKVGKPKQLAASDSGLHKLLDGAQFQNNPEGDGVVVAAIASNSPAAYSGLRPGDVIIAANRMRVQNVDDLKQALGRDSHKVLLLVNRNGGSFYLVIQ